MPPIAPPKLRGPLHPDLVREARAALLELLTTRGIPGVFAAEPRPVTNAVAGQLVGVSEQAARKAIAARHRTRAGRPAPAPANA